MSSEEKQIDIDRRRDREFLRIIEENSPNIPLNLDGKQRILDFLESNRIVVRIGQEVERGKNWQKKEIHEQTL